MSALSRRLDQPGQMAAYHPYGTGATPMTMPLALVRVEQDGMTYQSMEPIWAGDPNAAPIPATAPGAWGQLHAAGRP